MTEETNKNKILGELRGNKNYKEILRTNVYS